MLPGASGPELFTPVASWGSAIGDFGDWQRASAQSPGTIRLYRYKLWQLRDLFPKGPASVETAQLVTILSNPDWSPATRKSVKGCWSAFFSWAYDAGRVPSNPTLGLPKVSVPLKLPRPAPDAVIRRALEQADPRLELMLMLAAYGGLRACEIARVHSDHLQPDLVGHSLHVIGKGRKERWVPVSGDLLARLLELDGYAFPNRVTGSHITPGHVSVLMSRGLAGAWTAHTLRHRMATTVYAHTGDLLALMELLGHARPETTMQYTKVPSSRLRAAALSAQPDTVGEAAA